MSRYPYDRPDKSHWKTFWSVFEAKQQRKRDQLNQLPLDQKGNSHGETET